MTRLGEELDELVVRTVRAEIDRRTPRFLYGVVTDPPDTGKRTVSVALRGGPEPSPGFAYVEAPVVGDRVRVALLPTGDRYVERILTRSAGALEFNVRSYGATGDGLTDDAAAFQAALDAANDADGGLVVVPAGRYKVTTDLPLYPNVTLRGVGRQSVIDASSGTGTFTFLEARAADGAATALTANAVAGANVLTMGAVPAGIGAGSWVKVGSTAVFGSTSQPLGELVRVVSATATTLTIEDPLQDTYNVADSASIRPVDFIEGVAVEDLTILGPADKTVIFVGIALQGCLSPTIRNVVFQRTHKAGIQLTDCVGARISDCRFEAIELAGFAYGVSVIYASQDTTIANCSGFKLRHLVTTGGGTARSGVVRRLTVTGCVVSQALEAGFDVHPAAEDVSFVNCQVLGSDVDGFMIQGTRVSVVGCVARDVARHGVIVQPLVSRPIVVTVASTRIDNAGDRGVIVLANATYMDYESLVFEGVTIGGCVRGFEVVNTTGIQARHVVVSGMAISGATQNPFRMGQTSDFVVGGIEIAGIPASTAGIYVSDASDGSIGPGRVAGALISSNQGVRLINADDVIVEGLRVTSVATGILNEATCANNVLMGNNVRGCTTPISDAGTGTIRQTAAGDLYNRT